MTIIFKFKYNIIFYLIHFLLLCIKKTVAKSVFLYKFNILTRISSPYHFCFIVQFSLHIKPQPFQHPNTKSPTKRSEPHLSTSQFRCGDSSHSPPPPTHIKCGKSCVDTAVVHIVHPWFIVKYT